MLNALLSYLKAKESFKGLFSIIKKAVFKLKYNVFSVNEVKSHIDLMSRSVCLAAGLGKCLKMTLNALFKGNEGQ